MKAQGLPINTIIIAILALVVLVVVMYIFTGKIGGFGSEVAKCPGVCVNDRCPEGNAPYPGKFVTDSTGGSCKVSGGAGDKFSRCCIPIESK